MRGTYIGLLKITDPTYFSGLSPVVMLPGSYTAHLHKASVGSFVRVELKALFTGDHNQKMYDVIRDFPMEEVAARVMEQDALMACSCAHANLSSMQWQLDLAVMRPDWQHHTVKFREEVIEYRLPTLVKAV